MNKIVKEFTPSADFPRSISPEEFRNIGYLQEVNRQFLHRLGLALAVVYQNGVAVGFEVCDARNDDDAEGWVYGPGMLDQEKADRVAVLLRLRDATRQRVLGYVIQPLTPPQESFSIADEEGSGE